MAAHSDTHYLLISGGGKLVDAIRDFDRASPIDAEVAHWICIDLMDVAARMLGALLPEIAVIDDFQQIESCAMRPGRQFFVRVNSSGRSNRSSPVCDWRQIG